MLKIHSAGALLSDLIGGDIIFEQLAKNPAAGPERPSSYFRQTLPCRDQRTRPTCAAFAGAKLIETDEHLSPEFIYHFRANKPAPGMCGRDVMEILKSLGIPLEETYPYGAQAAPSTNIMKLAAKNRITGYARVTTTDGIKQAIQDVGPVYILLPYYSSDKNCFWRKSGNYLGYHAVVAVGFDYRGIILQNSWGTDYADSGHVIIPYDECNNIAEAWIPFFGTATELEQKNSLCVLL